MAAVATRPKAISTMDKYTESINILIHADPGAGKTVLAGLDLGPEALILSTESGLVSAKRFGSKADIWRIKAWDGHPESLDLVSAFTWLDQNPDHGYEWVILDSLTRMQYLAMRGLLRFAHEENPNRDLHIPAIQDYLKVQLMMKDCVADFCELPANVLFTALSKEVEDENGDPLVMPYIDGKGHEISAFICGEMQMVGHLSVKLDKDGEPFRRLYVQRKPPHYAKDRYGIRNGYLDEPTLPKLHDAIKAALLVPATRRGVKAGPAKRVAPIKKITAPAKRPPIEKAV